MRHLRLALRNLSRNPFVTVIAGLSLALGIGANAAIYSLFDQALLAPLPVREPDELINLAAPGPKPGSQSCNQAGDCEAVFSYAMFRDLEAAADGVARLAGHRVFGVSLTAGSTPVSSTGLLVSGAYFSALGLRPARGRLLDPQDDRGTGEHPVVVLGHRFWNTSLGADPNVVGRPLVVNGRTLTVVGVAPEGFEGTTLGVRPDVYVPLSMRAALEPFFAADQFQNRRSYWVYAFGRLAPGVSLAAARTRLDTAYRNVLHEVEVPLQEGMSEQTLTRFRDRRLEVTPGRRGQSELHGDVRTPLVLLLAITVVVLLIACANIANLLLAQGAGRTQEMAIRGALGAGRARLVAQLLTESAVLAVLGGVASVLVAYGTLRLIGAFLPGDTGDVLRLDVSPGVVLVAAALALATGLLFGLYPALHATRTDLVAVLRAGSGQVGARAAARFRTTLVTLQIALSMALLVASGLFLRSLVNVSRIDLGMDTENVVQFAVGPMLTGYELPRSRTFFERLEGELAALPGVTAVTAALVPMMGGDSWGTSVEVAGFESGPDVDNNSRYNVVGPGYFGAMRMKLVAGRDFTVADVEGSGKVAIVNRAFLRKFRLDERQAVGTWISPDHDTEELDTQIVGVVADARYSEVKEEVPPVFYTPYRQELPLGFLNFYVRATQSPEAVMPEIRRVVQRLDPALPVENLKTLRQQVRESVSFDRMITTLSAAFAALATLLAAIGLYGVLAYSVAQRTREIGVRMAIGAHPGRIRAMVLRQMGRMLLTGGVLGLLAAFGAGRFAESLLYGMSGYDPLVFVLGVVALGAIAFAAAYVPALRASRVDPMVALRHE